MNESDTLRPDNLDDKKREVLSVRASYDWQINLCAGGGCLASGEPELKAGLRAAIDRHGVDALIRETGCQGPCSGGPVVTVIPGNVMYFGMTPDRAEEFVTRHLMQGELLEGSAARIIRRRKSRASGGCGVFQRSAAGGA
jgi:(2Fe-2S) ferredoxin